MADLAAIAAGIRDQMATVQGLRTYAVWPDQLNTPAAIVLPGDPFIADASFDSAYDVLYDALVLVKVTSGDERATLALFSYLSPDGNLSIRQAIEADTTLGGTAHGVVYQQVFGYGFYEHAGVQYLGMKLRMKVLA